MTTSTGPSIAARVFRAVQDHLSPPLALATKLAGRGAVEVAAADVWVSMSDGRRLLDFGSYAVTLLGHRHPAVVAAVCEQLQVMPTATRSMGNPTHATAATALVDYFAGAFPRVHFGLNGADAVEVAVKLARVRTGRPRVLAVTGSFHGKSLGALALTHHAAFRAGLPDALPPTTFVPADDPEGVARELHRGDVAAVVFEPIQGENGVRPLDPAVLRRWCDDVHRAGGYAIADEIQTGLHRCGGRSVAREWGLEIDAVLLGKPLGGGVVPVSAMLCTDDLYRPMATDPFLHTATFGGHPLCTAAVPATLAVMASCQPRGDRLAALLSAALSELRDTYPDLVVAVRGKGLLWGLDFANPELAGEIMLSLLQNGLIVSPCLSRPSSLRLLPPLVAEPEHVERAMDLLSRSIRDAGRLIRNR
ncbi:aspartate aminotransferase family protein [Micromonospora sp. C95]|uniref:aspartate aminotransferase family protein n=1 Tax=Micromonospora sp. C95 TaxID=2824882 RepID=UPI001B38F995|nr:aspartate aminotransferase family protein [Micromonospora sp. C95]MBQ1026025.1 aspartate aminotransferase family protein [Micromonospora sp. C95]